MSIILHIVYWILARRLFLLWDREFVSSYNLVWLAIVFLWWARGEGAPFYYGLKVWLADRFWFEIRSQFFCSSLVLGFFIVFLRWTRGWEVVVTEWSLDRMWLSFGEDDLVLHLDGCSFRVSSGNGWFIDIAFQWLLCEGRVWLGVVCWGVFYGVYFWVFRLYTTPFSLYSLNHGSMFVLSRDLVFK